MKKEKSKYYPCMICGKDAVGCFSPDLDIKGLCFCEKHREEVRNKCLDILWDVKNK